MLSCARKLRDFYEKKPDAPLYQAEFGFFTLDRWKKEGYIDDNTDLTSLFGFDPKGSHSLGQLGWCEAAFAPLFEEKFIEDRNMHEVVQDHAGRHVLYFKGRRSGFMPEYLSHPVTDKKSWEENCRWRLYPDSKERYADLEIRMLEASKAQEQGKIIVQDLIGGYMYLRSLIGTVELLYMFYDDPGLIHACMETWLELSDKVTSVHQQYLDIDEIYMAEDICYNHGPLISPDMMREFLLPYYSQLLNNTKKRRRKEDTRLYYQVDTDGFSDPVIPVYMELGMDYLSPFEVASGCDVVRTGTIYPDLLIRGGFDKRILAAGKDEIDKEIDRILPVMKKRGGYIPMCDHGVPEEVSFENYMHYRKRMLEYSF